MKNPLTLYQVIDGFILSLNARHLCAAVLPGLLYAYLPPVYLLDITSKCPGGYDVLQSVRGYDEVIIGFYMGEYGWCDIELGIVKTYAWSELPEPALKR